MSLNEADDMHVAKKVKLVTLAPTLEKLKDHSGAVRAAAVDDLGKLNYASLVEYKSVLKELLGRDSKAMRASLLRMLTNGSKDLRIIALETLTPTKLEPEAITAIIELIKYDSADVRTAVLGVVPSIHSIAKYVNVIKEMFKSEIEDVRACAVTMMGALDEDALAEHAPALVCTLDDEAPDVRVSALRSLCFLNPKSLAEHVPAVVLMLKDHAEDVRTEVVEVLEMLDPDDLRHHACAIQNFFNEDTRVANEALLSMFRGSEKMMHFAKEVLELVKMVNATKVYHRRSAV